MSAPTSSAAAAVLPELTQQLHRFFHALDVRGYDAMLELFTEDCRWLRQGRWLSGRAAVRAALEERPSSLETRHVMTNAFVAECTGDGTTGHAVLEAYMTAYRYPHVQAGDGTLPAVRTPLRFNRVTTRFVRAAGGDWRIAEQRMVADFDFVA